MLSLQHTVQSLGMTISTSHEVLPALITPLVCIFSVWTLTTFFYQLICKYLEGKCQDPISFCKLTSVVITGLSIYKTIF